MSVIGLANGSLFFELIIDQKVPRHLHSKSFGDESRQNKLLTPHVAVKKVAKKVVKKGGKKAAKKVAKKPATKKGKKKPVKKTKKVIKKKGKK